MYLSMEEVAIKSIKLGGFGKPKPSKVNEETRAMLISSRFIAPEIVNAKRKIVYNPSVDGNSFNHA